MLFFSGAGNTRKSVNLAVYSFCGMSMLIWFACRVNMVNEKFKVKQLQTGVQDYIEKLGTKTSWFKFNSSKCRQRNVNRAFV